MATNLQLLKDALTSNNNDCIVVHRLLKEALGIPEESLVFKRASSPACATDLLSISQPQLGS